MESATGGGIGGFRRCALNWPVVIFSAHTYGDCPKYNWQGRNGHPSSKIRVGREPERLYGTSAQCRLERKSHHDILETT